MKAALIVATALAVASADVSHLGYNYKVPQTSYGIPSYQINSGSQYSPSYTTGYNLKGSQGQYLGSTYSHGNQASAVPTHTVVKNIGDVVSSSSNVNSGVNNFVPIFGSGVRNGFTSGGLSSGYSSSGVNSGLSSGLSSGLVNGYRSGVSNGQYYTVGQSQAQPIYIGGPSQVQYASAEKYQQYVQVQQQPAQVYKHFYVHAAPEEPEVPKPRTPIVLPPPQKHYKIIFVKTPNVSSRTSQIVPVQPQNEEKTIVYVLSKKPEEQQEVIVPKVEQKPPSKPEVFFIKYNNKDDQAVINNIVNDYNKDGQSVSFTAGGETVDVPTSSSSGSYSGLPSVTSFSNFPTTTYSDAPSSSVSTGPSTSFSSVPSSSFSTIPSSSFSSVPSSSFSSVPSSSFSSVPSSSFSSVPSSSFSSVPSVSYTTVPNGNTFSTVQGGSSYASVPSSSGFSSVPSTTFSGVSGPSYTFSSGAQNEPVSVSVPNFGLQSFGNTVSVSPVDSGVSASVPDSNTYVSGVTSTPVIVSTTPSLINDDFNSISTSQGIPHETYGPPKFRVQN